MHRFFTLSNPTFTERQYSSPRSLPALAQRALGDLRTLSRDLSLSSPETKGRREEGCFRAGLGFAGGAFRSVKNEGDRQDRGGINPIKLGVDTSETKMGLRYSKKGSDDPFHQQRERRRKKFDQAGAGVGGEGGKQSRA